MTLTIRPYADADLEALTALWLESWISTGLAAARTVPLSALRERLPREISGGWRVHVGWLGTEMAGFLALDGAWLEQLFIAPARQSQGLGKVLLDFVKARRPDGFHLTTALESGAPRFYEREGLVRAEITRHPRFGHPIVRYDWRPAPPSGGAP